MGRRGEGPTVKHISTSHPILAAEGANARLGCAPSALLGESGSVYFVTGVRRAPATVRRGSDIGGEAIRVVHDETLRPWIAGTGVESGISARRGAPATG